MNLFEIPIDEFGDSARAFGFVLTDCSEELEIRGTEQLMEFSLVF
jgi:hypothetical protein